MPPSSKTIKRLCTLSGNRCAFYGCAIPLVDDDSETIAGEICHIKASRRGGPRYDPGQTEDERQSFSNLLLLCSTHHTIIDADVTKYSVEYLQAMKAAHNPTANIEVQPIDAMRADRLLKKYDIQVNGPVTIQNIGAQTLNFNGPKYSRPRIIPPMTVVGGSPIHRRYISHLLKRYKEFASKQSGRTFKHAIIFRVIETRFGATWEWVEINRFDEFAEFIQERIDNTLIGKLNRSKGTPNYSSFERYCQKYQCKV
jgi:hypothetical protein